MAETSHGSRAGGAWLWAMVALLAVFVAVFFGTGSHFGSHRTIEAADPPTTRLANALVELDLAPELDDQTLQQVVQAVVRRATEGDVESAAFVLELAAMQRRPENAVPEPVADAE